MKYNRVSKVDFDISEISFGSWQLGNNQDFDCLTDEESINLVKKAVLNGITLFDTAPNYGNGNSERLLGEALKSNRDKVFINSKFGHSKEGTNFDVEALEPSIKKTLERLQTTYLDSVILHNPELDMLKGTHPIYEKLEELKHRKVINYYGVSVDTAEELEVVLTQNSVDVIEVMFNIIHQSPKKWFDEIKSQGILLLIKVPLDSGWLTGKYNEDTLFTGIRSRWTDEVKSTRLNIVERVKGIIGDDMVSSSLRFILDFDAVSCVIPGVRNEQQLFSNIKVSHFKLDEQKHIALETLYSDFIEKQDTPW
jgi:aryl-alcohol dehydrogenase-like predicted oxidoreductase